MANRFPHVPPRRRFLRRLAGVALGVPLVAALVAMLRREQAREVPSVVSIPADVPMGLSVVESAIVYREPGGAIHAFSGRCTHLGCRIDRVIGDEAVCPCHGSRYRQTDRWRRALPAVRSAACGSNPTRPPADGQPVSRERVPAAAVVSTPVGTFGDLATAAFVVAAASGVAVAVPSTSRATPTGPLRRCCW